MQITFVDKTVLKCQSENDFHCMTIYRSKDQLPDWIYGKLIGTAHEAETISWPAGKYSAATTLIICGLLFSVASVSWKFDFTLRIKTCNPCTRVKQLNVRKTGQADTKKIAQQTAAHSMLRSPSVPRIWYLDQKSLAEDMRCRVNTEAWNISALWQLFGNGHESWSTWAYTADF